MAGLQEIQGHTWNYYGGDVLRYQRAVGQVTVTGVYEPEKAPVEARSSNGLVAYHG